MTSTAHEHDDHDDFGGFGRDLAHLVERRRALQWMGGLGLAGLLAACGSSSGDGARTATSASTVTPATDQASTSTATSVTPAAATVGAEIPDETAGPYPADGSNGPDVLGETDVVRADITSSFGSMSGTADGVPTTVQLTIVDAGTGAPLEGGAVYLWHCTADGRYSLYEVTDQNYLRGIQVADEAGRVAFTSVFPGCYSGRWPHCHFEVYDDLDAATGGGRATKTSQLALPQVDCETVYADAGYGNSAANLGRLSLAGDNVFSDGWEDQLATIVGAGTDDVTVSLLVRV